LCRWEIPRESYPAGRAGYLRWRRDLQQFHARKSGEILREVGYDDAMIARVQALNLKRDMDTDPDCQTLEDALCLVFLEHQLAEFALKTEAEKVVRAIRKSWDKMSERAREEALKLQYSASVRPLVEEALGEADGKGTLVDVIGCSLEQPPPAITYHAGRILRELWPDKVLLECSSCGFDLEGYLEAGHATSTLQSDHGHNQVLTCWRGCREEGGLQICATGEEGIQLRPLNAFLSIEWRGKVISALCLTWTETMREQRAYLLVADTQATVEEFYSAVCTWSAIPHGEVLVFEQGNWRKDRDLYESILDSTFDGLVLIPGLKEALRQDVSGFFDSRDLYSRYRVPWKRGILLLGPPGNGKTHAVKALCHSLSLPVLYVRSLEPAGMFHGSEHANISQVFSLARKTAPCLLILEDLDALITPSNRSLFLNELDGFARNTGICVVATTNFPERLDSSILERPSRFDRKYTFDLPALAERRAYLEHWNHLQAAELQLSVPGIHAVADATAGFSFAYLKELCLAATMAWINSDKGAPMDTTALGQAKLLEQQRRSLPTENEPRTHFTHADARRENPRDPQRARLTALWCEVIRERGPLALRGVGISLTALILAIVSRPVRPGTVVSPDEVRGVLHP
jgi:hypothetical protein